MSTVPNPPAVVKAVPKPKRPRPPRSVRLVEPPLAWLNEGEGRIEITEGPVVTVYFFREFASALPGRAFHVRKDHTFNTKTNAREDFQGVEYDIRVHTPADSNCDCLGFTQWHHCRHVESLAALVEHGRLPVYLSTADMKRDDPEQYRRTMNATAMHNTPRAKDAYVAAELAAMDDDDPDSATCRPRTALSRGGQ